MLHNRLAESSEKWGSNRKQLNEVKKRENLATGALTKIAKATEEDPNLVRTVIT